MILTHHGIDSLQRKKPPVFLTYIDSYVADGQSWKVASKTGQVSNTISYQYDNEILNTPIGTMRCSKLKLNNNCTFSIQRLDVCSGEFFVLSDNSEGVFDVGFPRLCQLMGANHIQTWGSKNPVFNFDYKLSFTKDSNTQISIIDDTYIKSDILYESPYNTSRCILLLKYLTGWNFFSYTYESEMLNIFINGILAVTVNHPYVTQNNFVFSLYDVSSDILPQPRNTTFCTQATVFDYIKSIGNTYVIPSKYII